MQLRRCKADVERWLAWFEPLLSYGTARRAAECRRRLRLLPALRADGQGLLFRLQVHATPAEAPLVATLRDALQDLDSLERDYRDRLEMLAPRSPAVPVDLERLRAQLAEAAARRELDDGAGASPEGMWARQDRGAVRRLGRSITQAYYWLARFAPLLEEIEAAGAEDCRRRLQQVPALRADGQPLLAGLERLAPPAEEMLVATLRDALRELDGLEKDYRQRLGLLAPGDPAGEVDLAPLRARLAEAAARREVAALGTAEGCTPPRFRLSVPQGTRCSQEQLELEGRELTLRRRTWLGPCVRKYTLDPESRARIAASAPESEGDAASAVVLEDEKGKKIRFAAGRPYRELKRLAARLNEYLGAIRV